MSWSALRFATIAYGLKESQGSRRYFRFLAALEKADSNAGEIMRIVQEEINDANFYLEGKKKLSSVEQKTLASTGNCKRASPFPESQVDSKRPRV